MFFGVLSDFVVFLEGILLLNRDLEVLDHVISESIEEVGINTLGLFNGSLLREMVESKVGNLADNFSLRAAGEDLEYNIISGGDGTDNVRETFYLRMGYFLRLFKSGLLILEFGHGSYFSLDL
jgi:hypothetical protein